MSGKIVDRDGVQTLIVSKAEDVSGYQLIDVRRPDEYVGELGHIEGAVLKTLGPELISYLPTLDKTKPILFICRSGARSATSTMMAMEMGLKNVYNLEGGMIFWNQLGLPVKK